MVGTLTLPDKPAKYNGDDISKADDAIHYSFIEKLDKVALVPITRARRRHQRDQCTEEEWTQSRQLAGKLDFIGL